MSTFSAVYLSYSDIAIAASLILISLCVSFFFSLRLEKSLMIASLRSVIQLSLIGLILGWIFAQNHAAPVVALLCIMTLIAGRHCRPQPHQQALQRPPAR